MPSQLPSPNDVIVRVGAAGFCRTDIVALKRAFDTGGASVLRGLGHAGDPTISSSTTPSTSG